MLCDQPACCGEHMVVDEYDKDTDLYRYRCVDDRTHDRWIENDDEVWK